MISRAGTRLGVCFGTLCLAGGFALQDANGDGAASPAPAMCLAALDAAEAQLDGFRCAYTDPSRIPRSYGNDELRLVSANDWTSGFVAGSFWYLFEYTRDPGWRAFAEQWTAALESEKHNTGTHDLGFMMFNSFGNGFRLVGTPEYEPILVQSAESLLTRFNPTVGATQSWDHSEWKFPVIVDNMMNLELLYFASASTGDRRFADAATTHAHTTLKNHYRPDSSSYHVVDFDPVSGVVLSKQTHQGLADDSAWSRGQAWGLYGFTMVYRLTRDRRFLGMAQNIAEFWLNHPNLPEDGVPYFDFDAPDYPGIEPLRDASAAAIATSALLELAGSVSGPRASRYREAALSTLGALASPAYAAAKGSNGHFLLMHSTGNQPAGSELDVAISYADYYYLEALLRCTRLND